MISKNTHEETTVESLPALTLDGVVGRPAFGGVGAAAGLALVLGVGGGGGRLGRLDAVGGGREGKSLDGGIGGDGSLRTVGVGGGRGVPSRGRVGDGKRKGHCESDARASKVVIRAGGRKRPSREAKVAFYSKVVDGAGVEGRSRSVRDESAETELDWRGGLRVGGGGC